MAVTGLANLAIKVSDIETAVTFYRGIGAQVTDPEEWHGAQRADVQYGALALTLFTRAIYEDEIDLPADTFLHPALFVENLDTHLAGLDVIWGPEIVSGAFGTRRIAFIEVPGGMCFEFMEQLDDTPGANK